MKDFKYQNKTVTFGRITGEVLSTNKRSDTHVSGGGGGTDVQGNIRAISISSNVVVNHEFWLKTEDGEEVDVKFQGVDIPLRPGQKVSVVYASTQNARINLYTILVNHSANKHWILSDAGEVNGQLKIDVPKLGFPTFFVFMTSALFLVIAGVCLAFSQSPVFGLAWGAAGVYIAYQRIQWLKRAMAMCKNLNDHLEQVAQTVYQAA